MAVGPRVLVACVGNNFVAEDGFGAAVVSGLAGRVAGQAKVVDFGIRGLDLVYTLGEGFDAAVFVDGHGVDPLRVLDLARAMGRAPVHIRVVDCAAQPSAERVVDLVVSLTEELVEPAGEGFGGFRADTVGISMPWPSRLRTSSYYS